MSMNSIRLLLLSPVLVLTLSAPQVQADKEREYKTYRETERKETRRQDGVVRQQPKRYEDREYRTHRKPQPPQGRHSDREYYYSVPWGYRDRDYRDQRYREYRPTPPSRHDRDHWHSKPGRVIVIPSHRHHRHYIQVRPFYYGYPRYKRLYHDDHFWGFLAFTLIALEMFDHLNDDQQRAHERAMYRATTSPIGESIIWHEDGVDGAVTPVWEGPSNTGQYCREYQHEITVGGRTEVAYGTACRRADGSWEIVQ